MDGDLENSPYNATTETDDEGTEVLTSEGTTVQPGSGGGKKNKRAFIKTIPGILMIVNTVLLSLSWMILAGWQGAVNMFVLNEIESRSFFLVVTVMASVFNILLLVIFVLRLHETKLSVVNWNVTLMLNSGLEAFLTLIVSAILLSEVTNSGYSCYFLKCSGLRAAGAFGILSVFGLVAQCTLHTRLYMSERQNTN